MTVYVPTSMGDLSDFPWDSSAQRAVSSAIVPYLSFHDNFAEAFPGTPAQNFALTATSKIVVSAGSHEFCTTSRDGSWLFVDGSLLVSNNYFSWNHDCWYRDFWYCMRPVCQYIQLNEGVHTITVNYLKQPDDRFGSSAALEVSMDGSSIVLNGKNPYVLYRSGGQAAHNEM